MMTYPTYSTWAKYKSDINQEKVVEFTNKILDNKYLMGQIEIDDKWETCYGSLTFDKQKFPNITQLTDYIHSIGINSIKNSYSVTKIFVRWESDSLGYSVHKRRL